MSGLAKQSQGRSSDIRAVVLNGGRDFAPRTQRDIWQCLDTFLIVTTGAGDATTARGWRPGVGLSTLKFTGQAPPAKNYPAPNVNSAEGKTLCLKALVLRSNKYMKSQIPCREK